MKVSLVVTVKDEESSVGRLIEGVLAQTRPPDEWIVVDGGSRDATTQLLAEFGQCTLLHHPSNIAEGRNFGVAAATGDVIVMTDAGCELAPDWLESLVRPLEPTKEPSPESRGCEVAPVDFVGGSTLPRLRRPFDLVQWSLLDQLNFRSRRRRRPLFSCRSLAFRRALWENCGFPEWLDHGEDSWATRCWQQGGSRAVLLEEPPVRWEMRPDLRSFWLQHLRYMRGDGVARMRRVSNSLRLGFYAALLLSLLGALILLSPGWFMLPAAAWLVYLALNTVRLLQVVLRQRRVPWLIPCLLWLPPLLLLLDSAKIAGFLTGLLAPGATPAGQSAT